LTSQLAIDWANGCSCLGICCLIAAETIEHGALDLDFPEVKVWVDKNGRPVRLERVENDESSPTDRRFMLAANEAVARQL